MSRRIQTGLLELLCLMGQTEIVMAPDGTLTVRGFSVAATIGGAAETWREVGGSGRMAASVKDGAVKAVWFDETVPEFVLQPVPGSNDKSWILPVLEVSMAILGLVVLSWPWSAIARRRYGRAFRPPGSPGPRLPPRGPRRCRRSGLHGRDGGHRHPNGRQQERA